MGIYQVDIIVVTMFRSRHFNVMINLHVFYINVIVKAEQKQKEYIFR